jgi:hypothetical protein
MTVDMNPARVKVVFCQRRLNIEPLSKVVRNRTATNRQFPEV